MKKLEKQFYMISSDSSAKRIEQLRSMKKKSLAIVLGGYLFNLAFFLILNHIYFGKPFEFIFILNSVANLFGITLIYSLIIAIMLSIVKIYRKHWPSFVTPAIIITLLTFLTISLAHYKRYYENNKMKTEVASLRNQAFSLLHKDMADHMKALELLNRAIKLNPNDAINYNNRGVALYKLGRYQQAIKDFNQAIHLDPNDLYAYNNRGNTYYEFGKKNRACDDWRKACDLGNCDRLNWAKKKGFCK
ncbi:MAG: tetratricopeptide repeat protein [Thermodesulfobacteriota bacterium]|nr:tetratricopeptide repeat protein [Thermodesulfobacteriota bacterium]